MSSSPPGKGADPSVWRSAQEALEAGKDVGVFLALASGGKTALRAVAAVLEDEGAAAIRQALAERGGEDLRASDPAQKLLRRASRRETAARERKNPIVRNEAFQCMECSFDVPPLEGGGVRNHCPRCLTSKHVDGTVPGDRAARCGGAMQAEHLEQLGGIFRVTHRCLRCGFTRRNRLYPDRLPEPDQLDSLRPGGPGGPGGA